MGGAGRANATSDEAQALLSDLVDHRSEDARGPRYARAILTRTCTLTVEALWIGADRTIVSHVTVLPLSALAPDRGWLASAQDSPFPPTLHIPVRDAVARHTLRYDRPSSRARRGFRKRTGTFCWAVPTCEATFDEDVLTIRLFGADHAAPRSLVSQALDVVRSAQALCNAGGQ